MTTTKPALPEPDAYLQIGMEGSPSEGDRIARIHLPKHYDKTWWRLEPLYTRAALSEQPCEPDMRHPKIQALIGSRARLSIELSLVEQLLDDPDCDLTALDMEYWNGLHDKLKKRLTAAHSAPVERVTLSERRITEIVRSVVSSTERPIGMVAYGELVAHAVIAEYELLNGITPAQGEQP